MITIKKDYWMLWEDGYGAMITVIRFRGRALFRKWNEKRTRKKLGI